MQSQRLLSCLLLLQGERRQTARQLASALEVSIRTVYRDVEALSGAGIPIHMERGPSGGIVLADDYRRALAQFTTDELQALFAVSGDPMADLGLRTHAHALRKLAGALPAAQRRAAEEGRERLLLDHNRWYRADQPLALLALLRQAVSEEFCVKLRYRDREGAVTERRVDPLGLVAKAGVWYLVAREEKGYRTFRAERIAEVNETRERFARPADFDLDAYWQASVASLRAQPAQRFETTLRIRASVLDHLRAYWDTDVLEDEGDQLVVRVAFPWRDMAVFQIIALGDRVSILAPDDLAAAVIDAARAAIAHHQSP